MTINLSKMPKLSTFVETLEESFYISPAETASGAVAGTSKRI
jgi:hypothetical protein